MIKSRNIVIISNISVELLFLPIVKKNFLEENGNIVVTAISYEEYRGKEFLEDLKDIDIIIVWLNLEVLIPEIHNGDPDCIYSGRKERYIKNYAGIWRSKSFCVQMQKFSGFHLKIFFAFASGDRMQEQFVCHGT